MGDFLNNSAYGDQHMAAVSKPRWNANVKQAEAMLASRAWKVWLILKRLAKPKPSRHWRRPGGPERGRRAYIWQTSGPVPASRLGCLLVTWRRPIAKHFRIWYLLDNAAYFGGTGPESPWVAVTPLDCLVLLRGRRFRSSISQKIESSLISEEHI
jgi:hypothetical protein